MKTSKHRHTGAGRYPEAVDFLDLAALDPGLRRGDGEFFAPLLVFSLLLIFAARVQAHDLQYSVESGRAVVIRMFYVDNSPFTFEGYEIFRDGEKLPYQVGRTDNQGRIAFLPDRAANWRIKAISEDGHGLDFKLSTNADAVLIGSEKPLFERYSRLFIGIAFIVGLFGLLSLYLKRKKTS